MRLRKTREERKSLRRPAWITLEGSFAVRECIVQDMSSTGAQVILDDTNALTAKLRLAFSRDTRTGRNCQLVWRRGNLAGSKFVR